MFNVNVPRKAGDEVDVVLIGHQGHDHQKA